MGSCKCRIEVQRICQYCEQEFTARTTVTKFCSHTCNQRAYKANKRDKKVKQSKLRFIGISKIGKPVWLEDVSSSTLTKTYERIAK